MIKRKNIIKIAIDSPAAAGAGTLAKAISKHYNLFYLDTGKIYRMIAYLKIKFPKKFNQSFIKSKIKTLKIKDLANKALLSDEVGTEASIISKLKSTRRLVHSFQLNFAYNPPKNYKGSCLDGRDITYNIVPDADFKFFLVASIEKRAQRRYEDNVKRGIKSDIEIIKEKIAKRDHFDSNRKHSPLKPAEDAFIIDTSDLTIEQVVALITKRIRGNV